MANKTKRQNQPSLNLVHITRTLYFFIAIYAVSIAIFDAGNLITRDALVDRWTALFVIFVINTIAWFIAAQGTEYSKKILTIISTLALLLFAGAITYLERGMASTSTVLYALPILIAATLKNRHTLFATTALCVGTYSFATIKYFNDFFNEGYRIQLWGSIILFSGVLIVVNWLVMNLTGLRRDSK